MKKIIITLFSGIFLLSSCDNNKSNARVELNSNVDSVSYALGANFGSNVLRQIKSAGDTLLNYDAMVNGFAEALKGQEVAIDDTEGTVIINAYMKQKDAERKEAEKEVFAKNISEGEAFLAENKNREGVIETESGLQYEVITLGSGELPLDGDVVKINYEGKLLNGEVFQSSYEQGEPIVYNINGFIPGWTEGLKLMPVGSKFMLYIPYNLAYNENPPPGSNIEPFSTLIFTVELLGIEK
jgi:FKBP-type peptidyl-prolyl cis-trans isomerase